MFIIKYPDNTLIGVIHIPKTAGTTLRLCLTNSVKQTALIKKIVNYRGPLDEQNQEITIYDYWEISHNVDLAHIAYKFVNHYINIKNCQVKMWLTCVRNPYSRIYSAYCWHQTQKKMKYDDQSFNLFIQTELTGVINNYIKQRLLNQQYDANYIHFIPAYMLLEGLDKNLYIIRQECFEEELILVMNNLNLKLTTIQPQHCLNEKISRDYEYIKHYDRLSLFFIEILYNKDFLKYNYRKLNLKLFK